MRLTVSALAFAALTTQAFAADPMPPNELIADQRYDVVLWFGGGIQMVPDYDGSDDYDAAPLFLIDPVRIPLPWFGTINREQRDLGFSIGPSFRFVGKRDQDDNPALTGLGDVDSTFEVGGEIGFDAEFWRIFGAARYGFGGHEGFVGEIGVDVIANVAPALTLTAGPRVSFGDDDYHDAYFSVTPAQSAASGLAVFDADAGVRAVGVEAELIYQINDDWRAHLVAGYDRLISDAGDSPIVSMVGSEDQFYIGTGVSYRIKLDLFD